MRSGSRPDSSASRAIFSSKQRTSSGEHIQDEDEILSLSPVQVDVDRTAREILEQAHTIAIVGASARADRPSHRVMQFLLERGYRCIPVNPASDAPEILGQRVYARLADIDTPIDVVDVFRRSEELGAVVDEAVAVGARAVWMQLGLRDERAAERAERAGLLVVMDRCPAIEIPRLGIRGPGARSWPGPRT